MGPLNITTEILTLKDARLRLDLIRPDVERLMSLSKEIRDLDSDSRHLDPETDEGAEMLEKLESLHHEWRECLATINSQGGYVKDPTTGLLDFYAWKDGEMVFLCWKHGEETITTWHGLHEGFRNRKHIGVADDF